MVSLTKCDVIEISRDVLTKVEFSVIEVTKVSFDDRVSGRLGKTMKPSLPNQRIFGFVPCS